MATILDWHQAVRHSFGTVSAQVGSHHRCDSGGPKWGCLQLRSVKFKVRCWLSSDVTQWSTWQSIPAAFSCSSWRLASTSSVVSARGWVLGGDHSGPGTSPSSSSCLCNYSCSSCRGIPQRAGRTVVMSASGMRRTALSVSECGCSLFITTAGKANAGPALHSAPFIIGSGSTSFPA